MIETRRLQYGLLSEKDRESFRSIMLEPRCMAFVSSLPSMKDVDLMFESRLAPWNPKSTHWLCLKITEKHSGEFVGVTGLKATENEAEVGFIVAPRFWGKGYAKESLNELVKYAENLGISSLIAHVTEGNIASKRVVEACGFHFELIELEPVRINELDCRDFKYRLNLA